MSVGYGFGLSGILPHDYSREQIIGNLRILLRLGFCDRIVEVIDGKPLEFTMTGGEVSIDEVEGAEAELVLEMWEQSSAGTIDSDDWLCIAPDSASVFLPAAEDFFEQLDNIEARPTYIESIGNVLSRIDILLDEIKPGEDDEFRSRLSDYRAVFDTALKFDFVVTISA